MLRYCSSLLTHRFFARYIYVDFRKKKKKKKRTLKRDATLKPSTRHGRTKKSKRQIRESTHSIRSARANREIGGSATRSGAGDLFYVEDNAANGHKFRHVGPSTFGPGCRELRRGTGSRRPVLKKKKRSKNKRRKGEAGSNAHIPDSIIRGRRKDRAGSFVGSLSGFVQMIYIQS